MASSWVRSILVCISDVFLLKLFLKDFIHWFWERGEGSEKERERNIDRLPHTGDLASKPGKCPLSSQDDAQSTELHQPGLHSLHFIWFPLFTDIPLSVSVPVWQNWLPGQKRVLSHTGGLVSHSLVNWLRKMFLSNTLCQALSYCLYGELKNMSCPGQVAQLVRALSWYPKVASSIPGQGTYKKQPMNT